MNTVSKGRFEITVKSIDEEQRIVRGMATTPAPDRVNDIVESLGVRAAPEIPLLLDHDSRLVVGRARLGRPTARGVEFEAKLPKITDAGTLKDRVDEAWGAIKHGLLTSVSIGFRTFPDKIEKLTDGGLRFLEVEVLELSLVAVPAQPDAQITGWKSGHYTLKGQNAMRNATIRIDHRLRVKVATHTEKSSKDVALQLDRVEAQKLAQALWEYSGLERRSVDRGDVTMIVGGVTTWPGDDRKGGPVYLREPSAERHVVVRLDKSTPKRVVYLGNSKKR